MGGRKMFMFDNFLPNGEPVSQLLYRNLIVCVHACCCFLSSLTFRLLTIISTYVFRIQVENGPNCHVICKKDDEIVLAPESDSGCYDSSSEVVAFDKSENDVLLREKEGSDFNFKFPFRSPEEIRKTIDVSDHRQESTQEIEIYKYSFLSDKDVTGFVREPDATECFSIKESYVNPRGTDFGNFKGCALLQKDFHQLDSVKEASSCKEKEPDEPEALIDLKIKLVGKRDMWDDIKFLSEKEISCSSDSHTELSKLCGGSFVDQQIMGSKGYELLPVNNFGGFKYKQDVAGCKRTATMVGFDEEKAELVEEEASQQQSSDAESTNCSDGFPSVNDYEPYDSDTELTDLSDGGPSAMYQMKDDESPFDRGCIVSGKGFFELDLDKSFDEELAKSESWYYQNLFIPGVGSSNKNFSSELAREESGKPGCEWDEFNELQGAEETHLQNPLNFSGYEESEELESLWEHDDIIQQLKTELKKVQAIGLPTIYEESEASETIDDLTPWNIEDKLMQEDPVDELHKFHKSYAERMRKLDILNYQKMHAIGFLHLMGPLRSMTSRRTSFRLRQPRKSDYSSAKFIKEIQSDLETVYVGQTCLSWEFLHWQHQKALELPECEHRQYNQAAGEFQQLQVLVQRFLENEPFLQGPRVQNYVQDRCIFRRLIQVPAIKEDCYQEKKKERMRGNNVITSRMLVNIIEEAIRTLWEFIKADKEEANAILKGFLRTAVELEDPADSEILRKVQADLQKKEKKLRDLLRTGNCLVKRFQKHREHGSDLILFFSQVDIKLVSRVLKMSWITTDQLLWCHKKLSKITFTNRKIHREPSFLLFPC